MDLVLLTDHAAVPRGADPAVPRGAELVARIVPALGLLTHSVAVAPLTATALVEREPSDAIVIDARRDLAGARGLIRVLEAADNDLPVLVILTEGGLVAVSAEWPVDDIVLDTAGPAEIDARLRVALGRRRGSGPDVSTAVQVGELAIDESTYTARLGVRSLDLTYKEFELLKFLAQHPDRVFSRSHLVQEVWGYDYFGGTRTVDVHVRRLRAKLGVEHEAMIGTVRNVGYKFVRPSADVATRRDADLDVVVAGDAVPRSARELFDAVS